MKSFEWKNWTNNYAKATNKRLNIEMGVNHSSLWFFTSCPKRVKVECDLY